jgi:hypothetical protein
MFKGADLIHSYSRADALADGTLVDVTAAAREAGLRWPTAVTRSVWDRYVAVPDGVACQDEAGRLWDVLNMLRWAIAGAKDTDRLLFRLHVRNTNGRPRLVTLKAVAGPGDDAAPVLTIMTPEED